MKRLMILLMAICIASRLSAVSEDSFDQTYASAIARYIKENAVTGEIRLDDNAVLRYQTIKSPTEKGILVILGGHTESYVKYAEFIYDLRDLGITFYALDQRGQGFSTRMLPDREKDFIPDYGTYLADLKAFMTSVLHPGTNEKVLLLGHSLGGAVAADYAERYPNEISGLILSSPYLGSTAGPLALLMVRTLDFFGLGKEYIPGGGPFSFAAFEKNLETHSRVRHARKMQDYRDFPTIRLGSVTNHWVEETERMAREVIRNAKSISCPTLVLQAEDDHWANSKAQDEFCGNLARSQKLVFMGAYHEVLFETDSIREVALASIRTFLQRNLR